MLSLMVPWEVCCFIQRIGKGEENVFRVQFSEQPPTEPHTIMAK